MTDGQGSGGRGLSKWRELGEKARLRVEWIDIQCPWAVELVGQRIKPNQPKEPVTPLALSVTDLHPRSVALVVLALIVY